MNLVSRTDVILRANPNRVMARIFVPGEEELIRGTSRAQSVIDRVLALTEEDVIQVLSETIETFKFRHRNLAEQFELHFAAVSGMMDPAIKLSKSRKSLIGAYLTQEYAFESTAFCNPSMVVHPDQSGVTDGQVRFLMSIRAVGEGHVSSIVFRTGLISASGEVTVEPSSKYATSTGNRFTILRTKLVQHAATMAGLKSEELSAIFGGLPEFFTPEQLASGLAKLPAMRLHDPDMMRIVEEIHAIARASYEVEFREESELSERVLWPSVFSERHGMEDARWVKFTESDGTTRYRATYTGFDGERVTSRVLETIDFRCFSSLELTGNAVANKGVAFFPRLVKNRYLALSRWDREANSIAYSEDGFHWNEATTFQKPIHPWDLVNIGNCGSPLETPEGWLVITHGVGPMRQYVLSAVLLDLEDPTIMLASLDRPLLMAGEDERNGYVPNVVYSCGGLIHNGLLILPYGFSDVGTRIATVNVKELISQMRSTPVVTGV
jgi:predicted GH43/DUF377 family glycosyl hydrolase